MLRQGGKQMGDLYVNVHALDAAYKPFPSFKEWASKASVDLDRWTRYVGSVERRAKALSPDVLKRAQNVATRAAAIDTGAIEGLYEVDRGFTYTVAVEAAAWETILAAKGENVRPLFEAQLHAYDFVLDLATKAEPISEAAIRALHVEICKAQDTYAVITTVGPQQQALPKGQYKALPNHVRTRLGTDHSYAPVDVTPSEMARLTSELRSEEFLAAHPVLQAAYAHYGLVVIHPFADGNGRVARALASAFTYRSISMPIVILSEQKIPYLDALEKADAGEYQVFVDFMLARALDTINLVDESLRLASAPNPKNTLTEIDQLYLAKGGLTYQQVDEIALKFLEILKIGVTEAFAKVVSSKVKCGVGVQQGGQYATPPGHRLPLVGGRVLQFNASTVAPATAGVGRSYGLLVPRSATGTDDILVSNLSPPPDVFGARIDELTPSVSGVLTIRVNMFAERLVNEILDDLNKQAASVVRRIR
jgi:Fic family protein